MDKFLTKKEKKIEYYIYFRLLDIAKFPLSSGWATKEVQKYGKKGGEKHIKKRISAILEECFLAENVDKSYRMTAQDMWNLKAQEEEIESLDIPKVTTIQGWITRYAAQLREKSAQTALKEANW